MTKQPQPSGMQSTPSMQVQSLMQQLNRALTRRGELSLELEQVDKSIETIRQILQGVHLGQGLAAQVAAEAKAKKQTKNRELPPKAAPQPTPETASESPSE